MIIRTGLGGGCHWCTEAVFQALTGVCAVEQGFARSLPPHASWSEAVLVTVDTEAMPLNVLIEIHLRTHASTSAHKMRGKYRSAVYVEEGGEGAVFDIIAELGPAFDEPLVTQVLPLVDFKSSEERFRNYYASDPDRPFCRTYIDPKLTLLRRDYADRVREDAASSANPSRERLE